MTLQTSRADLHCHSTASVHSKLGVQRSLGLPECATPPEEVLELATRRGMDFVTITDHDTIDGVLQIADDPRVFLGVELTAWFRGEPQAVHVLCLGLTPDDHEWLQASARDLDACAEYLHDHEITCALAHPFYAVEQPLEPRHRRRLAELFPIWETRNGSRARELNAPAAVYIETHGGTGIGGSDDHAGVDIGRTYTQTPAAATPQELLEHIRCGRATAGGDQGSAAKWAHAAMALAIRSLRGVQGRERLEPQAVFKIVSRLMAEGDARRGEAVADLAPADARALLDDWLAAADTGLDPESLLAEMQRDGFSHADLFRRARSAHERKLARATGEIVASIEAGGEPLQSASTLFGATLAAIPYAPAAAFLAREKSKLVSRENEPSRIALVADGVGGMHGVTHTLEEIRERGVPGFEVEVVGTDHNVDRRLAAVAEVDIPFYPGLKVGVPSLPAITEALAEGRYDAVHLCSPGPAGVAAAVIARIMGIPTLGSYHTELAAYAGLRSRDPGLELMARMAVGQFYGRCDFVLSPSDASDRVLCSMGIGEERIGRWDRGVDVERFSPLLRDPRLFDGGTQRVNVLYAGRLTHEKGAELLVDAFIEARRGDPRLHLLLAGGGPEEGYIRQRLGDTATFLGWLQGDDLARAYASADLFLFASRTDTFGQVLLEAQASGLPVIAVAEGGPCSIIDDGRTGVLCPPDATILGDAVVGLARSRGTRERLARAARQAVMSRSWDRALEHLADGYRRVLGPAEAAAARRAA